jgi:hypothetical protein
MSFIIGWVKAAALNLTLIYYPATPGPKIFFHTPEQGMFATLQRKDCFGQPRR